MKMSSQLSRTRGYSLIEAVVVIALLGVLIALSLGAIQRTRETARRATCTHRLRELGLAIQNYQSSFTKYPPNFLGLKRTRYFNDHSVFARLLPFLDGDSAIVDYHGGGVARSRTLELNKGWRQAFLCPSEPFSVETTFGASYRCSRGLKVGPSSVSHLAGAFDTGVLLSPNDFMDGLSNTACMSERPIGNDFQNDLWANVVKMPMSVTEDVAFRPLAWAELCRSVRASALGLDGSLGRHWNDGASLFYNHVYGPNAEFVDCGLGSGFAPRAGLASARSYHDELVHVLSMDASVAGWTSTVDSNVWWALGTRSASDDGE